eukprot:TRINITY_DN4147_c0_g1_i2.p1 TRINITY_DN4147_c0_g1~~TRINITY_DN4147_c0_g1_i2.p1  ORF type:complete len:535 (-),score=128.68 TRINITY_DN4147_c0_g1_i2:121-1725(-)
MDSGLQSQFPDNSDVKASFRKPSNDAANRKYRRRSPVSGSASSSSDDSPKHDRSHSPFFSKEDPTKMSDDRRRKTDDIRDFNRDSGRSRSGRGSDSYRHSDRQSYGNSHDYHRHDDYNRHYRHADEEDRNYQRSRSGRETRGGSRSDYTRKDSDHDRSRDNWRSADKYSRDKSDDGGHRSKDKEREATVPQRHRQHDKDLSSDRDLSGSRQVNANMDGNKSGERDRHRDRGGGRDDKRDQRRSLGDYKNEHAYSYEESRGLAKNSIMSRDNGGNRMKETQKSGNKESDEHKDDATQKRTYDDRERDRHKEGYNREREEHYQNDNTNSSSYRERSGRNEQYEEKNIHVKEDEDSSGKKLKSFHSDTAAVYAEDGKLLSKSTTFAADEKPPSSSKQAQETIAKIISEAVPSASETEVAHDLNAAKVAAMKAAELVNRNLVGGGFMSADQKKKLLWGNKKNTTIEESGNRWDMPLFTDRERQEKFNKLMGVKGELKPDNKPDDKDRAEKQEQLQLDLEKQYTAGLRRRDGRTVGLGL